MVKINASDYFFGRTVITLHGTGNISGIDWNHPFPLVIKLANGFDRYAPDEITLL